MTHAMYEEPDFIVPHPPISLAVFLVLEEAICAAWEILRLHPPSGFDLANSIERQLNHHLQEILKDRIWNRDVVSGFDDELIRTITRPAVRNYNGKHIDKQPDLMIELVDIPSAFGRRSTAFSSSASPLTPNTRWSPIIATWAFSASFAVIMPGQ